ncbi:hypothetical protein AB0D30_17850 [Streptomyces sp. NPDC048409]|uniref:hypothetical protein n=1 Tax=Streptomyces sp. NPDC048409 TaxID=3154723 RepID=UPI00343590B2
MTCPSSHCGSSNVQLLSPYVGGLPAGAPNRERFARPATAAGGLLPALGLIVLGVLLPAGGEVLAEWENTRICLACTERWAP